MDGYTEPKRNSSVKSVLKHTSGFLMKQSEVRPVVKFLAIQVKLGKITIEQIPERYRDAVKKELKIN